MVLVDEFEVKLAAAYAAWTTSRGRQPAAFYDLYADDIELHSVLEGSLSQHDAGPFIGKAAALGYFIAIAERWEMLELRTDGFARGADTVIWHGHSAWRNMKTLRVVAGPKADIWTVRGGRAVRLLEIYDSYGFARAIGLVDPPPE